MSTYRNKIYDIAVETFEVACFMFPLKEQEKEAQELKCPEDGIQSLIGFEGAVEGRMIVNPSADLLSAMAANMLGVEDPDQEQKLSALSEIANIICGNSVPLFTKDDNICYIQPPQILKEGEHFDRTDQNMSTVSLQVLLDEGVVGIEVFYSKKENDDKSISC